MYYIIKNNTKNLTDNRYRRIHQLRKGDLIKTLEHGYKPIDRIGKRSIYHDPTNDNPSRSVYICYKDTYPELFEDLTLIGNHSILVHHFISKEERDKTIKVNGDIYVTENKYRLPVSADCRSSIYESEGIYTIYYFSLESKDDYINYGMYANGLLVETHSNQYLSGFTDIEWIE